MIKLPVLPNSPGVYFFKNAHGKIIYVGKANNLHNRIKSYFSFDLLPKTAVLVSEIKKIDYTLVESEVDALLLEANYIQKLKPKYNLAGKDDRSNPYVEIPSLKIIHISGRSRSKFGMTQYFGPYPPGSNIRRLLRFLKIQLNVFPFLPKEEYEVNLKKLINFLSGKRKLVQKQLHKEMLANAKAQKFEEAQRIKESLEQIEYITSAKHSPWQYEQNPNLVSDRLNTESTQLKELLGLSKLEKIECYDISNISGKSATGGQVTFINGVPEKKFYRRYKIKTKNTPDDYAMLKEVLSRRLKSGTPLPDLIVVDGGVGQVNAAMSILRHSGGRRPIESIQKDPIALPSAELQDDAFEIIGLAKKLETIILENGQEIYLKANSPALHLLQRLRDEAHRFSRKYHFYLRSKKMLE